MMRGLLLLTACLLCDPAAVKLAAQALPAVASSTSSSSPAFFWSSLAGAVQGTGAANSKTSYETVPFSALLPSVLRGGEQSKDGDTASGLLGKSSPDLLVLFAGPEVDAAQLAQRPQEFQVLQNLLQSSAASLSLPYASHTVADLPGSIEDAITSAQLSGQQVHRLGNCQGSQDAPPQLALPPAKKGEKQVVVVCGPQQNVPASMRLLQAVADLVQDSGRSHAFLFSGRPQAALSEQQRRRLLSEGPWRQLLQDEPATACNAKCRSQVMILQGIILTVTLLSSLAVGLFMMHAVGTPSRFETPKEAARQD